MTNVRREAIKKRLAWIEPARLGLLAALGDIMDPLVRVHSTVDPLKLILKVSLKHPLAKGTRSHLRTYLRCHAEKEECELPIIRITDTYVQAEILIGHRYRSKNAKGQFKGKRRFERKSENNEPDIQALVLLDDPRNKSRP